MCAVFSDIEEDGNDKLKANGSSNGDTVNGVRSSETIDDSGSDAESRPDKSDTSIVKSKDPMADLEKAADAESMDMDTGDDSDA